MEEELDIHIYHSKALFKGYRFRGIHILKIKGPVSTLHWKSSAPKQHLACQESIHFPSDGFFVCAPGLISKKYKSFATAPLITLQFPIV